MNTALKTQPTNSSVANFIAAIPDPSVRKDVDAIKKMMAKVTGKRARMWGTGLIGFGRYHYRYASGHAGSWFLTGLAPRKTNITLYIMSGFAAHRVLLDRLGRHKTAKSCLYIKRLADVDFECLRELVTRSVSDIRDRYEHD